MNSKQRGRRSDDWRRGHRWWKHHGNSYLILLFKYKNKNKMLTKIVDVKNHYFVNIVLNFKFRGREREDHVEIREERRLQWRKILRHFALQSDLLQLSNSKPSLWLLLLLRTAFFSSSRWTCRTLTITHPHFWITKASTTHITISATTTR